ncbi:hypothetical protein LZD49_02600 [Dyadobacter sp. CY261]|uniref:hypothetical protein n=1 Tax=Dyadobacter sp. CY261 TaxID=2907203 RepID=UPI001F23A992|nr:hypothetical protein [Dyadobacter sp. CY261]MCF0069343.1 hypothetical protein [Dyadobacter sp. CY261]
MARPIEETPVLSKREWKKFEAQLYENRNERATPEELEALKKNFESFSSPFMTRNSNNESEIC